MTKATRVPRYTSYPTAPHFGAIEESDARAALARVDGPLSVYVHVPFCKQLCWYCGCHREIRRQSDASAPYTDLLIRELELLDRDLANGRETLQLAFGGGTPSFLLPEDMTRLVRAIEARWPRAEGAEWSMELDPRTVDPDRLDGLMDLGFNRFSLGVQDIHQEVMRAVNREQPHELSEALVERVRDRGGVGLSIDLLYGLPVQTEESWGRTLEWAVALGPDRMSIFPYAHVPWMQPQQKLIEADLPGTELRNALRDLAWERLSAAGYIRIGMDHFAKPTDSLVAARDAGALHRNFQGYSTHRGLDMVGLGTSAISSYGGSYVQNLKDLEAYTTAVKDGQLPIERGFVLSDEDQLRREVIGDLLCRFAVRFGDYGVTAEHFKAELDQLEALEQRGWIRVEGDAVQVLPEGAESARMVAAAFDQYLGASSAQYSRLH
ncbi:MAG: oxygen-independent coproporphyrinogen III oxidase [Proteobacteria bacterium]|nr:oxygen-independent coproporphyrinogen III oxidase [Pseudomonadota bacterium]